MCERFQKMIFKKDFSTDWRGGFLAPTVAEKAYLFGKADTDFVISKTWGSRVTFLCAGCTWRRLRSRGGRPNRIRPQGEDIEAKDPMFKQQLLLLFQDLF